MSSSFVTCINNVVPLMKHPKPQFLSSNLSLICSVKARGKSRALSLKTLSVSASPASILEETVADIEKEELMTLKRDVMPKHLAIIMDGNRRWAAENGLPVSAGYEAGLRKVTETLQLCHQLGVETVSVYMFSSENWNRSKEEVDILMRLYEEYAAALAVNPSPLFSGRNTVRFGTIGDTSMLPESFRRQIKESEMATRCNKGVQFVMAVSYGARQEIIGATKAIASKVDSGEMSVDEITDEVFERELQTKGVKYPCPDLLIRTSGEKRLSNFMLWQMAYTELHFVDKFFPDLEEDDILKALISFQGRKRRFGE